MEWVRYSPFKTSWKWNVWMNPFAHMLRIVLHSPFCFLNRSFCRSIFTLPKNHLSTRTFYFQYSRTKKLITTKITCISCCCVSITRINIIAWSIGIECRLEIFADWRSPKDSSSESEFTSRLSNFAWLNVNVFSVMFSTAQYSPCSY